MSLAGIWTGKGIDKLAAQTAGGPAINITRIVLGDGGGRRARRAAVADGAFP